MPRRFLAWTAGSLLLASPLLAQNPPVVTADAPAPAVAEPVDPRNKIVAEVKFESVAVEDVVQFLQDFSKDYRAVVVRKAKNEEGPLVTMRLKNVSVQQVIEVIIAAHGGIEVTQVDGPGGPVDVIIIQPREVPAGADAPKPLEAERAVRVYRLAGIVQTIMELAAPPISEKDSLDKILSLIKATLELTGGREAPTIQVHPETMTLIFKGSPQQHAALGDVLVALEGNRSVNKAASDAAEVDRLRKQLDATNARFEEAQREAVLARAELVALQRRSDGEIRELSEMRRAYLAEIEKLRASLQELQRAAKKDAP